MCSSDLAAGSAPVVSTGSFSVGYSPAQSTVAGAAPLQLRLPLALTVQSAAASPLALTGATLARIGTATDSALSVKLVVATGTLAATDFAGLTAGSVSADAHTVTLSGTAAALNTWLASGKLGYTGAGETLELSVSETGAGAAQALLGSLQLIAASPVVPSLALPTSIPVQIGRAHV